MIGSVRGEVLERSTTGEVIVDVGGVGYRVTVPLGAVPALEPGRPTFLFVHTKMRDDTLVLYGFPTRDERDTFEALIAASGVGPKLALAILSVHPPAALRRALVDDDQSALTAVPGVGPRTAKRLMVELQERLVVPDIDLEAGVTASVSPRAEVRAALAELGYGADEIREVVGRLPDDAPVEELLREALQLLNVRQV